MCGISGIFGGGSDRERTESRLRSMLATQHHRGPDSRGLYLSPSGTAALGHNRLSILDLSEAGNQPMASSDGNLHLVFNGEIYNYLELREDLRDYPFRSRTDSEVILAAWQRYGSACLDRMIGMWAFLLWDEREQRLFAARDRFGVKPLYFARHGSELLAASEIRAIHDAGISREPDIRTWSTYLTYGTTDTKPATFWRNVEALEPGHLLTWSEGSDLAITRWYDLPSRIGPEYDDRPVQESLDEYQALLENSVRLRFRSDVPVGINLSGGLDSSVLLATVGTMQQEESRIRAFTFYCGDPAYDELPWVRTMLDATRHPSTACLLRASDVPELAESVQETEDEPFGGVPTLAYAHLFQTARSMGTIVLLDGQGMDEQWAGYDYYAHAGRSTASLVQGTSDRAVRPECLSPELRAAAEPFEMPRPFMDPLRNLQYRDLRYTKIPRALRFNDRASMRSSTELREPFLDHRLIELAFHQSPERKIADGVAKWGLRRIAAKMMPGGVVEAPKRPLQTPQREWLRGPLQAWAEAQIEDAVRESGGWLDRTEVRREWQSYLAGGSDNSFWVWQWISLNLCLAKSSAAYA